MIFVSRNVLRAIVPLAMAAAMLVAQPSSAAESAGRVQFVSGEVLLVSRSRPPRVAKKGDEVWEGDSIVTNSTSSAQLLMADGGILAIRPGSRLVVERYHFEGDKNIGKSILQLLYGGFRTITGIIGRTHSDDYVIRTETATIGVRGTDHETFHVRVPAAGEAAIAEPGTYNRVYDGETVMRGKAGTLSLGMMQIGFVPAAIGRAPLALTASPVFMRHAPAVPPPPRMPRAGAPPGPPSGNWAKPPAATPPPEGGPPKPPAGPPGTQPPPQYVAGDPRFQPDPNEIHPPTAENLPFQFGVSVGGAKPSPLGSGGVGADLFNPGMGFTTGSGAVVVDGQPGNGAIVDPAFNLVAASDAGGFRYSRDQAPLIDVGGVSIDGTLIKWGLYAGGSRFDPFSGNRPAIFFHFGNTLNVTSGPAMQAIGGPRTFTMVAGGFTKPTLFDGTNSTVNVGGQVNSFSATVNFTTLQLTDYNLNLDDSRGFVWTVTDTGMTVPLSNGKFSTNLGTVNCGSCGGAGTGKANVLVSGPSGGGIVSSYDLHVSSDSVAGAVVGRRPGF